MGLQNIPTRGEKQDLYYLALRTGEDYSEEIEGLLSYQEFQTLLYHLEDKQPGYHEIPNPGTADINKHLKRFIK